MPKKEDKEIQEITEEDMFKVQKEHLEQMNKFVSAMSEMKETALTEDKCPECGKVGTLTRTHNLMCGPYGGRVKCSNCTYEDGMYNFLGKSIMISIEPMKGI